MLDTNYSEYYQSVIFLFSNLSAFCRQEALMYRQSKERRIATSEGSNYKAPAYPKCTHVGSGSRCGERTVPLSKFCADRILRCTSTVCSLTVFSVLSLTAD